MALTFDTYTRARSNFKELLDAADNGRAAVVRRDIRRAAVVDAEQLRGALDRLSRGQVKVVSEQDFGWTFLLPGVPVAAQAVDFETALGDFIEGLREYAEDWQDGLRTAPNHAESWGLVQLIELSTDEQLQEWVLGTQA